MIRLIAPLAVTLLVAACTTATPAGSSASVDHDRLPVDSARGVAAEVRHRIRDFRRSDEPPLRAHRLERTAGVGRRSARGRRDRVDRARGRWGCW